MLKSEYYEKIYSLYGNIKRARGNFLYTQKGIRLTDLYREDGRALLGWGGDSAWTMFKNELNRGVTGSFFSSHDYRLKKACSDFFNASLQVYVFADRDKALSYASSYGTECKEYCPWSDFNFNKEDIILFVPYLPWTEGIYLVCVPSNIEQKTCADEVRIPSPLKAAVCRSIYNLKNALSCDKYCEKTFFIYDKPLTQYFNRKGPWLYSKITGKNYDAFVDHCMKLGILINPNFEKPSLVPFGCDKGIFEILKKNPFKAEN